MNVKGQPGLNSETLSQQNKKSSNQWTLCPCVSRPPHKGKKGSQ